MARRLLFILSLLLAGPARAQDWADHSPPGPIQPAQSAAAQPTAQHKPVVHKPQVQPKAVAAKPDTKVEKEAAKPEPKDKKEPAKSAEKPAKPEPAKTVAKNSPLADALAGIAPHERLKILAALSWTGDTDNIEKGDDPLAGAIKNYQKRIKAVVTGVLTPTQRDNLIAAAHEHEDEFGWSVVTDPATGVRIGLPTKLVPVAHDAARGTRWSSAHGEVQVETFRIKNADLKLTALFEQEKTERGRKIEYSVLHDDNFFISGFQGLKKFSVRATLRDGEVRGFTILFDQMMETIVEPAMVAMASAFAPFPERVAPFAELTKSVDYGSGLVVSAKGHIVTPSRMVDGCQVIVVPGLGNADRVAEDKTSGLALLRVYGARKLSPLALPQGAPKAGDVTLVGVPDPREQDGRRKLTELKAKLVGGTAIELSGPVPVAGFEGAAALDTQGHLLGLLDLRNAVVASNGPVAAPAQLIPAAAIGDFLATNHVPPATPDGYARDAVVRVICVRK